MGNLDLLEDACARLPHTTRAMFGGHGLFASNGGMFAGIVDEDRIVLKFAAGTPEHDAFRAEGGAPWRYDGKMTMKEWLLVPDRLYDEPHALAEWAAKAHRIAPPKAAKKAAKKGAKAAAKTTQPRRAAKASATKAKAPAKKAASKKGPSRRKRS